MKNEQIKPKSCYQCTYRRSVPGHHSSCIFNWNGSTHFPPEGDPDGIKNGWWIFPTDYNPVWMIGECMEFQSEEVVDRDKVKEIPFYLKKYPVTKEELLLKARQTGKTEDMSSTEWQLYQARQTGKTEAMIQSMVYQLKNNENIGVAGCKDPAHILKRLTELGVSAEATVMSYYRWESDEQVYTGYLFQVKPPKINDSIYDIFDINTYYHNGNEVMYEGNVWVYSEDNGRPLVSVGIYPGTGNGWKVKKS